MILLDTNVVSEPARPQPDPRPIAWLDHQPPDTLYLSVMTVAELRAGIAQLSRGPKRRRLERYIEDDLLPGFAGRILPFDEACTPHHAAILAKARGAGYSLATPDAIIAAVAKAHAMKVASRDLKPFRAAGLPCLNPWSEGLGSEAL
jgi:predicted nucleic acid-binding protein